MSNNLLLEGSIVALYKTVLYSSLVDDKKVFLRKEYKGKTIFISEVNWKFTILAGSFFFHNFGSTTDISTN
jgi:hypothetical protein